MGFPDSSIQPDTTSFCHQVRAARSAQALTLVSFFLITGCARQKNTAVGSTAAPGKPASVDRTWVAAARSCWPDLAKNGYTERDISEGLLHHLGAAFPTYSALKNNGGHADLSMPITTVLPPDVAAVEHSQTPVLNRGQAVAGTPPERAVAQSTNNDAPPDSLCSIQSGIPQGFSK